MFPSMRGVYLFFNNRPRLDLPTGSATNLTAIWVAYKFPLAGIAESNGGVN